MRETGSDLFDPRADMESDYSRSSEGNFGFAFNDSNFSDRVLRIEIVGGPSDCRSDADGACTSIADWARLRKRRREDVKKENVSSFPLGANRNKNWGNREEDKEQLMNYKFLLENFQI